MVQQNVQAQTSKAGLHSLQNGAFFLILKCFNNSSFFNVVFQLEIKVLDTVDARCSHEVYLFFRYRSAEQ